MEFETVTPEETGMSATGSAIRLDSSTTGTTPSSWTWWPRRWTDCNADQKT